jgi:hypothetical protein
MSVCVARACPTNDHNGVKFAVRSRSAEWPLAAQLRRPDMPLRRAAFHPTQPPMTADANGSFGATPAIGDRVVTVRYAPKAAVAERSSESQIGQADTHYSIDHGERGAALSRGNALDFG